MKKTLKKGYALKTHYVLYAILFIYNHFIFASQSPLCISLGSNCTAAFHLRNSNLRTFAYPFDWILSRDIHGLFKAIKSDFERFFLKENLMDSGMAQIRDVPFNMFYLHDFPYHVIEKNGIKYSEIDANWLDHYPRIKEKYDRRIERFKQLKNSTETIYFFRYFYTTKAEAIVLKSLLDAYLFPIKSTLVVVGSTPEFKEKWHIADIKNFYFFASSWKEMTNNDHFIKLCAELDLNITPNKMKVFDDESPLLLDYLFGDEINGL
jgi:hypothetical protein